MENALSSEIVRKLQNESEILWINPLKENCSGKQSNIDKKQNLGINDIGEAQVRLERFAPFIMTAFPETTPEKGLIESKLVEIPRMKEELNEKESADIKGKLLLKKDSHLAIAGSIKARGGIYEVLKHTEELALEHGLLQEGQDYRSLTSPSVREFFSKYKIQVGSTGNLGLSIGIISAAIGYEVIVHMSADAKQWKKDLLRSHGVTVVEYQSDYGEAVKNGRARSDEDPTSYFIDDENSKDLFLGYAVAALRLEKQLHQLDITVDQEHPLFVYIPCGVGGAPGGIVFGLKEIFGEAVHCFFVEPTQAPCMLLGMATGKNNHIAVQDIGLTGQTHADGLAVGRPSGFVGQMIEPLLSGIFTLRDDKLYRYMRELLDSENIFIEPSAAAAFEGVIALGQREEARQYLEQSGVQDHMDQASHIVWATGGKLVPEEIRKEYENTWLGE